MCNLFNINAIKNNVGLTKEYFDNLNSEKLICKETVKSLFINKDEHDVFASQVFKYNNNQCSYKTHQQSKKDISKK